MKCSQCNECETKVIESRDVADGQAVRRRRECTGCGQRFTTYERLERPQLVVVKNNGMRQLFSRQKLMSGLYRACEKTSVTSVQLEQLAAGVEQELYGRSENEVCSREIGEMVMNRLAGVDEVAYVRFASVYRRFSDITSFENELSKMRKRRVDVTVASECNTYTTETHNKKTSVSST